MDQSVFDELTQLIDALRAETTANSISPERMGALLQRMVDIMPDLDDSSISAAASAALEAAHAAATQAQTAMASAQSAINTARNAASRVAALASSVADALAAARDAISSAQSATDAAQQASRQASQLATRVATLESFKTSTESKLSRVPEYHSATWLDSEEGSFDANNPGRRQLVRYSSMLEAINDNKKLIKKYNIVASGMSVTSGTIILSFLEVDGDGEMRMGIYRVTKPSGANYCEVEKHSVPMPVYNANWALHVGGTRENLDMLMSIIEGYPQVPIMINSQPVVWSARRSNDVVQLAVMIRNGMRTYTVTYDEGAGETNTTYEESFFTVS